MLKQCDVPLQDTDHQIWKELRKFRNAVLHTLRVYPNSPISLFRMVQCHLITDITHNPLPASRGSEYSCPQQIWDHHNILIQPKSRVSEWFDGISEVKRGNPTRDSFSYRDAIWVTSSLENTNECLWLTSLRRRTALLLNVCSVIAQEI